MKISDHVDQELLTYTEPYPYDRLRAKFGPRFEHPTFNRAGNTFQARKVDVLRSYKGDDVFDYSTKGKTYVIPNAASITPVNWPWAEGPNGPRIDVITEFDAIRDMSNRGSRIVAPGLIDQDLVITKAKKYLYYSVAAGPLEGIDVMTGEKFCSSNKWPECEIPKKYMKNLPARTFFAYSIPFATDINDQPEDRTLLVYTGPTKGVQVNDGAILLYGFEPSSAHPLIIESGL